MPWHERHGQPGPDGVDGKGNSEGFLGPDCRERLAKYLEVFNGAIKRRNQLRQFSINLDAENICSSVGGELPFPKNEQENTDYYNAFITINKHAKNGVLGKII